MKTYHDLMRNVLENGTDRTDRTGIGTRSLFGAQMRFKLADGFPLITTKKVHLKSIIYELLWFLRGDTNVKYLQDNGVSIWNEWAGPDGELGRVYGAQWRSWRTADGNTIDQISDVVSEIQKNPHSRRHLVVAYNPGEIAQMALPPCHAFFQFYVSENKISLQLYQRSADLFLGVPFNIASYSLLLLMVAQVTGLVADEFIHTLGDTHIYLNHIDQVNLQLARTEKPLPNMVLNPDVQSIFKFEFSDFNLQNYDPHPAIRAKVAV